MLGASAGVRVVRRTRTGPTAGSSGKERPTVVRVRRAVTRSVVSHSSREENPGAGPSLLIPTHFYHATTLQLRDFARQPVDLPDL